MPDVETARGVRIPIAHPGPIRAIAGSTAARGPGLFVTAGGDSMIRSWAAGSGASAGSFTDGGSTRISFLGVAESAGLVVVAKLTGVRRFDMASGQAIGRPLRAPGLGAFPTVSGVGPVAIHAEGRDVLLVAGSSLSGGRIYRWDALTGEPVGPDWAGHDARLLAVAVLRLTGGRRVIVSAGDDDVVRRWDAQTGEPIGGPLPGIVRYPVTELVCVSGADGRDVVIGQEYAGPIHRWDAATGSPIGRPLSLGGPKASAGGLAVTPDGRTLWSLDEDGTPWRWDLTSPEPVAEPMAEPVTGVDHVAVVSTESGFLFVTGCERGRLRRWDPAGRAVGDDLTGHPDRVQDLIAVPAPSSLSDGRVSASLGGASASSGGLTVLVSRGMDGARCWDAVTGRQVGSAPLPVGDGMAAAWLPDGRLILASGSETGFLRCDVFTGTAHETDDEDDEENRDLAVQGVAAGTLPDGRQFFAGAGRDGSVYLVDAATGDPLGEPLRGLDGEAFAVAVAELPGGTVLIAAGGADRRILCWDAATGVRTGEPLTVARDSVMRLAFRELPDGRLLLIAVDDAGKAWRWDARTGERVGEVLRAPGGAGSAARLAGTAPGEIIAGATCATTTVLPDGRVVVATGYADGSITVS